MTGVLRRLVSLAPVARGRFGLSVALGALTVLFGVGLMGTAGYLISRAAERPAVLSLMVAIVAVRVFGIGRPVLRYFERLVSHDVALRSLGRARAAFLARVEPLAPAQLSGFRKGDLLARMVADVDAQQNLYLRGLGPPVVALLASAVAVGAAAAFVPLAGVVLAAGLLVGGVGVPALSGAVGARAGRRQAAARGRLSAEIVELMGAAPEVAVFGGEAAALNRVRSADASLVGVARRDAFATGAGDGLGLLVTGVTVAGVLLAAIDASAAGRLDHVLIAMLALLALAAFEAVTPLAGVARELSATVASGRRVLEVTSTEPLVRDPAEPVDAPHWPFVVALENVTARYPGAQRPALTGFDLRLSPGERVALVGPSGAGKTTVVNLLLRFLDPSAGRVTLGDHDLRDYRQADIRRCLAVAGQESHLFSASIRDNVRLARPEATASEISDALRRARILDWATALPDGLDTLVGEEGRELSGGQRQRIVLARALLADAPVLVLDEPTAHLDGPTATALIEDIFTAAADRTVLLITHRTEGLDLADRIVPVEAPG